MRRLGLLVAGVLAFWGAAVTVGTVAFGGADRVRILHDAATGRLHPGELTVQASVNGKVVQVRRRLPWFSGGLLTSVADGSGAALQRPAKVSPHQATPSDLGLSNTSGGCGQRNVVTTSVRVNQDCSFFGGQAETGITFNPADQSNLLAGQNDHRVGFNQCGIDWSLDNGRHWGDLLPPFRRKINDPLGQLPTPQDPNRNTIAGGAGTGHTYDAASDPAVAFDSQGRAFFSCLMFDINDNANNVLVTASPREAKGSFFFNVDNSSRAFIVAEDNSNVIHDKQFIVADTYAASPNRDNVYVTWTVFFVDNSGTVLRSPIYGSMSTDHAATWSTPQEISGSSSKLCFFGNRFDPNQNPHACNFDQGSDPKVLPNGDLVVVFNNANQAASDPNAQQLAIHCSPTGRSQDGTAHLNCASPSKVGADVFAHEPQCNFGRGPEECVPGPWIRTNDYPRLASRSSSGHLYAVWQDYRGGEYNIQIARSMDGGLTWSATSTVNPDHGVDHYFAAADLGKAPGLDRVGVSYYRSERVPNENKTPPGGFAPGQPGVQTGRSDYVLAGGTETRTPFPFLIQSPVFAPPDGAQSGFNGDYTGLTIPTGNEAHPIWSDTRNVDPFAPANGSSRDEDVFSSTTTLPQGRGQVGPGTIGRP